MKTLLIIILSLFYFNPTKTSDLVTSIKDREQKENASPEKIETNTNKSTIEIEIVEEHSMLAEDNKTVMAEVNLKTELFNQNQYKETNNFNNNSNIEFNYNNITNLNNLPDLTAKANINKNLDFHRRNFLYSFKNTKFVFNSTREITKSDLQEMDNVTKVLKMMNLNFSERLDLIPLSLVKGNLKGDSDKIQKLKNSSKTETYKSLGSVELIEQSRNASVNISKEKNINFNNTTQKSNLTFLHNQNKTDAPMLNYIFDTYSNLNKHQHRGDRFGGPKFVATSKNVTVDTDETAYLECRVTSLRDKLVSWVRRKGDDSIDILTIGLQAYTTDLRFTIDYLEPDIWRLKLSSAQPSDSGTYECQLSTYPPLISRHYLRVYAPEIRILDDAVDKFYERNSTLRLGCQIRHLTTTSVSWLHQSRTLNDDIERGGISIRIEAVGGGVNSTLELARLTGADAGTYTCFVRDDLQKSVNVHVLNESLAELQQTSGVEGSIVRSPIEHIIAIIPLMIFSQILKSQFLFYRLPLVYFKLK